VVNNDETIVSTIENSMFAQHDLTNIVIVSDTQENNVAVSGNFSWRGERLMSVRCYPFKCA
jgi:hypothetical protein